MDIRTLYLSSCLVTVLMAAAILCLAWWRPQARYVLHWAAGNSCYAIGSLLVALRGFIPDGISILAGNAVTFAALYLWLEGFQTLVGTRRFSRAGRALILIGSLLILYFWAWDNSVVARIASGSAIAALLLGFATIVLLTNPIEALRVPLRVSAGLFGAIACVSIGRLVVTLLGPVIGNYMSPPPIQSVLLIPYTLAFIAQNYVFLWLVIAHEASQHAETQEALLQQVQATRTALEQQAVDLSRAKIEAEAANATKSTFLATMSHEIRTPLNGVLGFADLLLGTRLEPDQRRYVELQREAGNNLLTVINDILDFSKLEAGKFEIEPVDTDLWALMESSTGLFRPAAQAKRLELALRIDPAVPRWVQLDGQRLRQAITNLLSNAIKFTRIGGVTLLLGVRETAAGRSLRFEVRDTGIGISPDKQDRLFQDFSQVDNSIARQYGGTGLGLAISRQLIQLMEGELGVETAVDEGSNFWIELPYRAALVEHPAIAKPVHRSLQHGGLHILVAEDAPLNQEIISLLLKRFGHQVTIVSNGAEAVEAVVRERYDLVLMDMQMPVMGGVEAVRQIRALTGPAARVPVIALTANVLPEEIERCRQAGMQGHLAKPIDPDRLMDEIDRLSTEQVGGD